MEMPGSMANVPAMLRSSPRATWDARSTISSWRGTNDRIEGMLNGLAMGDSLGYDGAAELAPVLPHGRMDTASKRKQAYAPPGRNVFAAPPMESAPWAVLTWAFGASMGASMATA